MSDATPFAFPLTWRFKPQLDSSLGLNKEIRAIMHNTLWILVDTCRYLAPYEEKYLVKCVALPCPHHQTRVQITLK